jgi:glucose-1-phosphate thymidylyltransferase
VVNRKGILLAGGRGQRLFPATRGINKHLLTVWDRPMIYHPVVSLILSGVEELLVISNPEDLPNVKRVLGNGRQWGLSIQYAAQPQPRGLADGLLVAADFLNGSPCVLALGDNIFHGHGLPDLLTTAAAKESGATVLATLTDRPQDFGVVRLNASGEPIEIVEKPMEDVSPWAVTGLYFFDADAVNLAATLTPSARGEMEISDLNQAYLNRGDLQVVPLGKSVRWWDVGSADSLLQASNFFQRQERELGRKSLCPEEAAFRAGRLTAEHLRESVNNLPDGSYRHHLELFTLNLP